jgi:hypothetical protein
MGMAPNPIVSGRSTELRFSEHARFRMEERDVDRDLIQRLITSPNADYRIDEKSGNYVFNADKYRLVMKKREDGSFMVLSIFSKDQNPV